MCTYAASTCPNEPGLNGKVEPVACKWTCCCPCTQACAVL